MMQRAIDEGVVAETAEHFTQEILKASSLPNPKRPLSVHHNDVSDEESSSSKDKDIYWVKPECRKFRKQTTGQSECTGCGSKHQQLKCCFRDTICWHCSKKGHIAKICQSIQPLDLPLSQSHKTKASPRFTTDSC